VIWYRQRMIRAVLASFLSFGLVASLGGCKKDKAEAKPAAATTTTGTIAADGSRHIPVAVNADGYTPDKIPGKPGEKLVLVFTRTVDSSCIAQVKVPDGKLVDLPMNTPVEVAVTVPQTGEVGFACGMDMFHGVVVAQP
jgi:plastocyanin domain-containing protein